MICIQCGGRILISIFKGGEFCSENCRKENAGEARIPLPEASG